MSLAPPDAALLQRFAEIVGEKHAITKPEDQVRYVTELRGLYSGVAALVLKPGSTAEVSKILALANKTKTAVIPQGGGTGLVGGQTPWESGTEIIISLERMNAVRGVSASGYNLTVEAGVTLANVQQLADEADRLFPLSLGSEGTCQIGGNLSTNAGGTAVLAYGNARDLVLGLEVVLANGEVWNGLKTLRKDNTGYDLKHLFIGAEGTLGIITAAALKLFPKPRCKATALIAVPSPAAAVALLGRAQSDSGGRVTGVELMPRIGLDFTFKHGQGVRDPLADPSPWYVLLELSGGEDDGALGTCLETCLGDAMEAEEVTDAVLASSEAQRAMFWKIRELMSEMQKPEGGSIKHDVSVPPADIPTLIDEGIAAVLKVIPDARPVVFGHVGDGNLHFNISQPIGADKDNFLARWDEINEVVHGVVARLHGSFSAEHGIGRQKRALLARKADPVGLAMMKDIKRTLDPNGILNPGKVLEPE